MKKFMTHSNDRRAHRIRALITILMMAMAGILISETAEAKFRIKIKLPKVIQRIVAPILQLPKTGHICQGFDECFKHVVLPRLVGCTLQDSCPAVPGQSGQDPGHSDPPPGPSVTLKATPTTCAVPCSVVLTASVSPNRSARFDWSGCVQQQNGGSSVHCFIATAGTRTQNVVVTNSEGKTAAASITVTGTNPIAPDFLPIAAPRIVSPQTPCAKADGSRTRPRFVSATTFGAVSARAVAVDCTSGDPIVAAQSGTSAMLARLDAASGVARWITNHDNLEFRGVAVPSNSAVGANVDAVLAAGVASVGTCGAQDNVGGRESKSAIVVLDGKTGAHRSCSSQTIFSYSGHEQHWAIATESDAVVTSGFYETCGFGHYVNVLTQYDLAGGLVKRSSEPNVDLGGFSCIGSSVGNAIAAGPSGTGLLFAAGGSSLVGEDVPRGYVAGYAHLDRLWKTRSSAAVEFVSVASDVDAVYAAGLCSGSNAACVEKFDARSGASLWVRSHGDPGSRLSGLTAPGNGHVYAVGSTGAPDPIDAILIDINGATGDVVATDTYDSGADDSARAIAWNGTHLYVIGDTSGSGSGMFVRRYGLER
jgi:hypothetical protein